MSLWLIKSKSWIYYLRGESAKLSKLNIYRRFRASPKASCERNLHLRTNVNSAKSEIAEHGTKHATFDSYIESKRLQARRSILVQVQSPHSHKELHSYCRQYGPISCMVHYTVGFEPMHFIIVEYADEECAKNALHSASHIHDNQGVPVSSQFLWFRAVKGGLPASSADLKGCKLQEYSNQMPSQAKIYDALNSAQNVSEQMVSLYEKTKLNDTGERLRFLTARQLEASLQGMFPNATALPFGSSVNGCGKIGCDLDLVLKFDPQAKADQTSRLIYQCKALGGNERSQAQKFMEAVGDLLQLFLPGCSQVRRILQARVPILKYCNQFTDVECDVSMTNMSAVYMSEMIHLYGSMDRRVRPLIFTVRKWAEEVGITNSSPGKWLTNFSLTLLVIGFLQKPPNSPAVLPSLNALAKWASEEDRRITEDGVQCTFLRDITKLPKISENSDSLETLLMDFFELYSKFDFATKAISLNESRPLPKPEHSALYLVNPLERGLNVSKNVSPEELERFRFEARNALWMLESSAPRAPTSSTNWGITSLFDATKNRRNILNVYSKQGRLMEVRNLFIDDDKEAEKDSLESSNSDTPKEAVHAKDR